MSFFSDLWKISVLTGKFVCPECKKWMHFENANEDTLVCDHCGYSVDIDDYGKDIDDEDYDSIFGNYLPFLDDESE